VIREITRPSTACCQLPTYIAFLLSEPNGTSCCRLGHVLNISHDSVNRFLNRESYCARDLFNEVKESIDMKGGTLSVDDTVLDKPYAKYIAYIGYFWSGKHHRSVKGINLITLYYTDPQGREQPVNFRVYDKAEGKTKNDYFLEMLDEVLSWGLKPAFVTGDSWYSCVKNLKRIRNHQLGFLFGQESNRLVSIEKGSWIQVQKLDIPQNGLLVWLRDFGQVKIFRTHLKDQVRHYAVHVPNHNDSTTGLEAFEESEFERLHSQHWLIEQYHRTIKQVCNIERFQVRGKVAVKNHLFAAICGYVELQRLRTTEMIANCYKLRRDLFKEVVACFIQTFSTTMNGLKPKLQNSVNA
jgi:Transposase DDE domain